MKKLLASIIAVISLFSISTQTFAQNDPIFERILDINYGVEDYEIQLANLDDMYFFNQVYTNMHSDFKRANTKMKQEIRKVAWDQTVITDCSHLLVFAAWDNYTADRINKMFDLTNAVRGVKNEGWENYRQQLLSSYPKRC